MSLQDFQGDLLDANTADGGDFIIENGLFVSDESFNNAVKYSLLGGNREDNGKIKNNKEWWGNVIDGIEENEKLVSRFQNIIDGLPMTVKNIKEAEAAALLDLKWLMKEKIVDKIKVSGSATGKNNFVLSVNMQKDGNEIFNNSYGLLWGAGNGI
jgi:phage gp46-like protein